MLLNTRISGGAIVTLALFGGCAPFDFPASASIDGTVSSSILPDNAAPLVVRFSKPIKPETLDLRVIPLDVDEENQLVDERGNVDVDLNSYARYFGLSGTTQNGKSEFFDDNRAVRITPNAPFPVARELAVLIEPDLQNGSGNATRVRMRLPFSYDFQCKNTGTKLLASGDYVYILNIIEPVGGVQVGFFANFIIDPVTGLFRAQFTKASRSGDASRCKTQVCGGDTVCRTLPAEACVPPSEKMNTIDEFPDFVPDTAAPKGFTFAMEGCVEDQPDGTAALVTKPIEFAMPTPPVRVSGLTMVTAFKPDSAAVLRASGSASGIRSWLGTQAFNAAKGSVVARALKPGEYTLSIPSAK